MTRSRSIGSSVVLALTLVAGGCATSGRTAMPIPPFSAAQLREAIPAGTVMVHRIEPRGQMPATQTTRFVSVDGDGATMQETTNDAYGQPASEPRTAASSWSELSAHALFPPDRTTREAKTCEVPAGRFECWEYTVRDEDEAEGEEAYTRYTFAPSLPGPPVLYERMIDGRTMLRMQLVRDSRLETAGAALTSDGR